MQSVQTQQPALEAIEDNPATIHSTLNSSNKYGIHRIIDVAQFSCFDLLIRVTSYALRLIGRRIKEAPHIHGPLTVQETTTAETLWIRNCQQSASELDQLCIRT
jgi:hypothetical protein